MSLSYCPECERIVEGNTHFGVEITINMLDKTEIKRPYEVCNACGAETTGLQEDDPREDR